MKKTEKSPTETKPRNDQIQQRHEKIKNQIIPLIRTVA